MDNRGCYNPLMDVPPSDNKIQDEEQGVGPLFGIIIIVVLLAAGGIYFLVMQKMQTQTLPPANQEQANS